MKEVASIPPTSSAYLGPAACPTCQSSAIVTKAKTPDSDTYWRCTKCGRSMARVTERDRSTECVSMAVTPRSAVRELLELIAALDRRVPQVQRAGEASIARDAAALKARALTRIEELERDPVDSDGI